MDDIQKFMQRHFRRILAIGGLILSLLALSVLLGTGPQSSLWMVKNPIPSGSKIAVDDVELVKANLTSDSNHFEGSRDGVVGQYAVRLLQSGDLIATTDISHDGTKSASSYLPIGVAVDDLPSELLVGDLVDIYVIPKDQTILPALVAHRVVIQSVDQKSRALGGNVAVSVIASNTITSIIVTAEAQGRLVLARDPL